MNFLDTNNSGVKTSFKQSFLRYNLSALTATGCDFITLSILHYEFDLFYPTAITCGGLVGASVAFVLGRNWTFMNKEGKVSKQGLKFLFINGFSIFFNTTGATFFVEVLGIKHILLAKALIATIVGLSFNFPMQRYFVFR